MTFIHMEHLTRAEEQKPKRREERHRRRGSETERDLELCTAMLCAPCGRGFATAKQSHTERHREHSVIGQVEGSSQALYRPPPADPDQATKNNYSTEGSEQELS